MTGTSNKIKDQSGTTLFELVVAMAIFTILILAVTSIYQLVYQSQRNAIDARNTQESMRYVMEVFSKELRSAQRDGDAITPGVCANVTNGQIYDTTGTELNFRNYRDQCVKYYITGDSLMVDRGSVTATATPNEIRVSNLQFEVRNAAEQARVTIKADVEALNRTSNKQRLKIQTTVSSRYYD
jgi:type II secretory pathway pseudopilin PulG